MKKNHALDFLKMFFMIIIITQHSTIYSNLLLRGYVAVEFFFITSGYFLYSSYKKNNKQTTFSYIKKRFSTLYPYYLGAFTALSVWLIIATKQLTYNNALDGILEAIMLPVSPFYYASMINSPIWYISVLITASALIYVLFLKIPDKIFNLIASITIITVYAFLIYKGSVDYWNVLPLFVIPWWRGFADLFIGVLLGKIVSQNKEKLCNSILITILEPFCFICITALMFIKGQYLDFFTIAFIIGLIFSVTIKKGIFDKIGNTKIIRYISSYEYVAYVSHTLVISLVKIVCSKLGSPEWFNITAILLCAIVYSIIFKFVVDKFILLINTSMRKTKIK